MLCYVLQCYIVSDLSTGMDPHIRATCTSYEYMSPADACHVWLKAVTFTVLVRLVKSKRSASDLVPYHVSAQLILLTYYSRYIGGTAVDRLSAVLSSIPKACENQLCNHADQNPLSVVYVNIRISWNTGVCISGRDWHQRREHYRNGKLTQCPNGS